MASWELIDSLEKLRAEFNAIAPNRDKRSDGSVGDQAHASGESDHNPDETGAVPIHDADSVNEVHAIDVDAGLNRPPYDMLDAVLFLVSRCKRGLENRLRYIIFNRTIWSASNDWNPKPYTGSNPHTEHAHFSGSYVTAREASTASWHLQELITVTAPTPGQIASHDVDPSAASQSWGGAAWTTLVRTGYLANTWAPAVSAEINALQARIDDESDDLDAVGASIALLVALIGQVGNEPSAGDPNVWYDTMRLAVRDELAAQGITGSGS
jgi:hypothetical protein